MNGIEVLVVDDEAGIRNVISDVLSRRGYEVTSAGDGETALAAARQKHLNIAFIDIRMPGMDGIELVKKLKSEGLCERIVMITGHGRDERVVEAMRLGASLCLMKPFRVRDVIDTAEIALMAA